MMDTKKMVLDLLNENYRNNNSIYMRVKDIEKDMKASEKEIGKTLDQLEKNGDIGVVLDARTGEPTVKANYSCLLRSTSHLYDMPYYFA